MWKIPQFSVDLFVFTKVIFNENLHFLWSASLIFYKTYLTYSHNVLLQNGVDMDILACHYYQRKMLHSYMGWVYKRLYLNKQSK